MISGDTAGLTGSGFRNLLDDVGPELNRAGATAAFGWTVGGRRSPGPTWINVTSNRGYGRLVRHSDGSFSSSAYDGDGGQLHDARGASVTASDLCCLIASLAGDGDPGAPPVGQSRETQPNDPSPTADR